MPISPDGRPGWEDWQGRDGGESRFLDLLAQGQLLWQGRYQVQCIAADLGQARLGEQALRALYTAGTALALRGLVEHPNLPRDLLQQLAQLRDGPHARVTRSMAVLRLAGKPAPMTDFAQTYARDPWLWTR